MNRVCGDVSICSRDDGLYLILTATWSVRCERHGDGNGVVDDRRVRRWASCGCAEESGCELVMSRDSGLGADVGYGIVGTLVPRSYPAQIRCR
jgi:hypothetical protein